MTEYSERDTRRQGEAGRRMKRKKCMVREEGLKQGGRRKMERDRKRGSEGEEEGGREKGGTEKHEVKMEQRGTRE